VSFYVQQVIFSFVPLPPDPIYSDATGTHRNIKGTTDDLLDCILCSSAH